MGRTKLGNLPTAIPHYCVRSIEMTGSSGGMDAGDSGRSDEHGNQMSVLACSPLCLVPGSLHGMDRLCYRGYSAVCVHVCISNRETVTAGTTLSLSFGQTICLSSHTASVMRSEYSVGCARPFSFSGPTLAHRASGLVEVHWIHSSLLFQQTPGRGRRRYK